MLFALDTIDIRVLVGFVPAPRNCLYGARMADGHSAVRESLAAKSLRFCKYIGRIKRNREPSKTRF
jgi:hypothetical protein